LKQKIDAELSNVSPELPELIYRGIIDGQGLRVAMHDYTNEIYHCRHSSILEAGMERKMFVKIAFVSTFFFLVTGPLYAENGAQEHFQQGLSYQKKGMSDEAIKEYKAAISLEPKNADAYYNIGFLYARQNQYAEAADAFRHVVEINPNDGEAHYQLAVVYLASEKYADAIQEYDKAKELNFAGNSAFGDMIEGFRYKQFDLEYAPVLDKKNKTVILKIKGNPQGDKGLIQDVVRSLESFENVAEKGMFEEINVEFIKKDKPGVWLEKWTVRGNNTSAAYMITFTLTPTGGTDYVISQIKE